MSTANTTFDDIITSDTSPSPKKIGRPRSYAAEKPLPPPSYEEVADLRGIENVLVDRVDRQQDFNGMPGGLIKKQSADVQMPFIAPSPDDIVASYQRKSIVVPNMEAAISSAVRSLSPQLQAMAENQMRESYAGKKVPTEKTLSIYHAQVESLMNRYRREFGIHPAEEVDVRNLSEWFLSTKLDTNTRTWYLYRTALNQYLDKIPTYDASFAQSLLAIDDEDQQRPTHRRHIDTSQMNRIKFLSPDDFDRIVFECRSGRTDSTMNVYDYIRANVRVGLRPWEFLSSEIRVISDKNAPFGRQIWMFVCNAKFSSGRANGPMRIIDLSQLRDAAVEPIWRTIESARFNTQINSYNEWLRSLNSVFRRLYKRGAVQNAYSSYSLRHQAVANWKSVYDPVTVAALAGHATPKTAAEYYGSAKNAWNKERLENVLVRPSQADIERIQNRMEMAEKRRANARGLKDTLEKRQNALDDDMFVFT